MFFDLHGHSKKLNSFVFACEDEQSIYACKLFPALFSRISNIFSYNDCTFGIEWDRTNTARAQVWNIINVPNVFTLETSFYGYYDKQIGKNVNFLPKQLYRIGRDLIRTLYLLNIKEDKKLFDFTVAEVKRNLKDN